MIHYHLIPMNFLTCNFQMLKQEWEQHHKIMWQVPGTPKKEGTDSWKIPTSKNHTTMAERINKGDIIYFYVFGIPSSDRSSKSRILLRGVVSESPKPVKYEEVYFSRAVDKDEVIIGFAINQLTTLCKNELENDICYSLDSLENNYSFVHPQGKKWPNTHNGNLSDDLIRDLESSFKKTEGKNDFQTLITHFNKKCFFSEIDIGIKRGHGTFKRKNGTDYYETHHFIPDHLRKTYPQLVPIIDDPKNLICVCPNCHRQLHYGESDKVSCMIDALWNTDEIRVMLEEKHFRSLIGVDNDATALKWIKKIYHVDF